MIHPKQHTHIIQAQFANASIVMSFVPKVEPAAVAARSAAGNSYITEPMYAKRIQANGPPTEANRLTAPITMTSEGPREAMAADLAPRFICSFVTPICGPVFQALRANKNAWTMTNATAGIQAIQSNGLFAIFKYSSSCPIHQFLLSGRKEGVTFSRFFLYL